MSDVGDCLRSFFFVYETPKMVEVESRCLGVSFQLLRLVLFSSSFVWVFVLNNGYQFVDNGAIGGTTNKIKGVAYSNSTDPRVGKRLWDSADLYIPPQDDTAFFLATNGLVNRNQAHSECPASKETSEASCTGDQDCLPVGKPFHLGSGVSTGVCNQSTNTCMMAAWCPLEDDYYPEGEKVAQLHYTADFTVLLKNHVHFPHYDKSRSNMIESIDKAYLRSCRYHPEHQPYCPIFRIGDIVNIANSRHLEHPQIDNDSLHYDMAIKGGVITITIKWDCDFDYKESECKPTYEFARLDKYKGNNLASGYNIRYTFKYREGGAVKRSLIKLYGILFLLEIEAKGRAFDIQTLLMNVGSSLGLMGIAEIICEMILLYIHKRRRQFQQDKVEHPIHDETEETDELRLGRGQDSTDCRERREKKTVGRYSPKC